MSRLLCLAVLLIALPACALAQCTGGIAVVKDVNVFAAPVGYEVVYTIAVTNDSDCLLTLVQMDDSVLGDLTEFFEPELPPGAVATREVHYTIQAGDPAPLENTVVALYTDDFGSDYLDTDIATVDVLHPSFTMTLECLGALPPPSTDAEFEFFLSNTGDVTLIFDFLGNPGLPEWQRLVPGEVLVLTLLAPCDGGEACLYVYAGATLPPGYGLDFILETGVQDCCPCEGTPVEEESWGTIKALHRS